MDTVPQGGSAGSGATTTPPAISASDRSSVETAARAMLFAALPKAKTHTRWRRSSGIAATALAVSDSTLAPPTAAQ